MRRRLRVNRLNLVALLVSESPYLPQALLTIVALLVFGEIVRAQPTSAQGRPTRPNVIVIITDDQGYGDIGAHGNTMIKTPELDRLWAESVRLVDFHVDPTCTPTRAALMTGRYSIRSGSRHTIMGRSLMHPDEVTLAQLFRAAGYRTGLFGKWHLGDNYPLRPQDRGFEVAVYHKGGGVGQGPDWWGNDYFDDVYFRNGIPERFSGYCTDVWFREALRFIEQHRQERFFCWIATNAPHAPYLVDEKYWLPYAEKGVPEPMARFYGMITNIDENIGRLRAELRSWGLEENTLLIFLTDNGTAAGVAPQAGPNQWRGFNAGMRGQKGSEYDGGHRVPCFLYWPAGGLKGGRDITELTAHIDLLPTLMELCGLDRPQGPPLDGKSLVPLLYGKNEDWPERILFVHSQRGYTVQKWHQTAVMTKRWRLVNGKELYDMESDPGQQYNVADKYPEVVAKLSAAYEEWWQSIQPAFDPPVAIHIGSPAENPTVLMSHDWLVEDVKACPWNQQLVADNLRSSGPWAVMVERPGRYRFELYRWPKHLMRPTGCRRARIKIGEKVAEKEIDPQAPAAVFELELPAGRTLLQTWLTPPDGPEFGAYFVWVYRLPEGS
ncbi:MAG: arylsulfatase [Thermoguttaceae bacterium]|nr:arylsulfatase [Thermoguttaceae bacterium]MDW8079818.1 arylsulfatase [Thermoguttaceae bacterium]